MGNKSFFNQNKVLIFGLLSAILLAANEVLKTGDANNKVLIFAGAIAGASFLANNLRGQWASIAGLAGTALATYLAMEQTGNVSYYQLILQIVIGYLAIVASPPKGRGYEHAVVIEQAKAEGEAIKPTLAQP